MPAKAIDASSPTPSVNDYHLRPTMIPSSCRPQPERFEHRRPRSMQARHAEVPRREDYRRAPAYTGRGVSGRALSPLDFRFVLTAKLLPMT